MQASKSALIVGGGVFGVSTALELKSRGYSVRLLDPGPIPHPHAASTDISKVIRPDYGKDALYTRLMEECMPVWRRWNEEWRRTHKRELFHESGVLVLRKGEFLGDEQGFEVDTYHTLRRRGHQVEALTTDDIRRRFPIWDTTQYKTGYVSPHAGWAESGEVLELLAHKARAKGVEIIYDAMKSLIYANPNAQSGRVRGVLTKSGKRLYADVVVVAAGAWTPVLLPQLKPVMRPVGQVVLHFQVPKKFIPLFREPLFLPYVADIGRTGFYGFMSKEDGRLKVGHHGFGYPMVDPDVANVSEADMDAVLQAALEREEKKFRAFIIKTFPVLHDAPIIFRRLCMYNDTFDTDFLIDHDPDRPGLVVATGGSGHGFKFTPILGSIIADVVERKSNSYAHRFRWRSAPKEGSAAALNVQEKGDAARFVETDKFVSKL